MRESAKKKTMRMKQRRKFRAVQFEGDKLSFKTLYHVCKIVLTGKAPNSFYKVLTFFNTLAFGAGVTVGWYCYQYFN